MLHLSLKLSEFESLYKLLESRSKDITIPKKVLQKLLMDHTGALQALKSHNIPYKDQESQIQEKPRLKIKIKNKKG